MHFAKPPLSIRWLWPHFHIKHIFLLLIFLTVAQTLTNDDLDESTQTLFTLSRHKRSAQAFDSHNYQSRSKFSEYQNRQKVIPPHLTSRDTLATYQQQQQRKNLATPSRLQIERESIDFQSPKRPSPPSSSSSSFNFHSTSSSASSASSASSSSQSTSISSSLYPTSGRVGFETNLNSLLQRYNLSGLDTSSRSVGSDGAYLHKLNFTSSVGSKVAINDSYGYRQTPMKWQNHTFGWTRPNSNLDRFNEIDDSNKDSLNANDLHFLQPSGSLFESRNPLNLFESSCMTSCHPRIGDLLIGRAHQLRSSSTCGVNGPERFCMVIATRNLQKCHVCHNDPAYKDNRIKYHPISNVVMAGNESLKMWWQSENGVQEVQIQFDLEATFQFSYLVMKFVTFRPAAMLIERSADYGKTWKPYHYFAANCSDAFPYIPHRDPQRLGDVVCEETYSSVVPSHNGDVIFKVAPPIFQIDDPYSDQVQDLMRITNLRINFTRLHTLGDNLLDSRKEIIEKYYYAVSQMQIGGACFCWGHASECVSDGSRKEEIGMVYGKCKCNHETTGPNCEKCKDLYNDLPWRPAIRHQVNACKKCECNGHATKCVFDEQVYRQSHNTSGGVCVDCAHHTTGRHCDTCAPGYFRNSHLPLDDPNVCEPCNCDARGSNDNGVCEPKDDPVRQLRAGACHCKANVDGEKCDRCKIGFWNFDESNPLGCQSCTCNTLGTIANQGCNHQTGECQCKPNVIGRDCDRCRENYYGIDEGLEGCKACDCDAGGSISPQCDLRTGQCLCRPHVTGRRCDSPISDYFVPFLDQVLVEAEKTIVSQDVKIEAREVSNVNERTWTGNGFVRVSDRSTLEFEVNNIPSTLLWNVGIRYETPQTTRARVRIETVEAHGHTIPLQNQTCRPLPVHQTESRQIDLYPGQTQASTSSGVVQTPICLAPGYSYRVHVEVDPRTSDFASVSNQTFLIDSFVFTPVEEQLPPFQGQSGERSLQEYNHYRCSSLQTLRKQSLHPVCNRLAISAGLAVFNGAQACDCDRTGSLDLTCAQLGGQCKCKPNVVGRRCDACAAGFYNFGPNGCQPCECHPHGAFDNICGVKSGQCTCRNNTFGLKCDLCQPGFWNYPNCVRCECNRHAEICDSRSGKCTSCTDNTDGDHCERCRVGYYGQPQVGIDIPCRACPCPGSPDSGLYHAKGCSLDKRTEMPVCRCETGYAGDRCDRCADNYWGEPAMPGGECRSCDCNGNVDMSQPGACDPNTGRCLRCLYQTTGDHCEFCSDGYYGDASKHDCRACDCYEPGTNSTGPESSCDRHTGQCRCLPGVTGRRCDQCSADTWNLASRQGCEPCLCDTAGSAQTQCNQLDGQCECLPGYGGKHCDECQQDFYGDPTKQCYACNCSLPGAVSKQCNKSTGACVCVKGVSGDKCDVCARGFTGQAPYCESCGECFENWDQIIAGLRQHTARLLEAAKQINQTGLPGAYKAEFAAIEAQLAEIEKIVSGANISALDVKGVEQLLSNLRQTLLHIEGKLAGFQSDMDSTSERITDANLNLASLQSKVSELEGDLKRLRENATALVEENVEGAYNLTKEAFRKSQSARQQMQQALPLLQQSEQTRKHTLRMLDDAALHYNESRLSNDGALNAIRRDIASLELQIPAVNSLVCDGNSTVDRCEGMCGGAGCGKCGGISCEKGATTIAGKALEMGKLAEERLNESKERALAELNRMLDSRAKVEEAWRQAQLAHEQVQAAKNGSDRMSGELRDLLQLIDTFLEESNAKPSVIRNLAEQCTALQISLTPEQVLALTRQINETLASLTDIDTILHDTASDLGLANALRDRADRAKDKADRMLATARKVLAALDEAAAAQSRAEQAIAETLGHVEAANAHLTHVDGDTAEAQKGAAKAQQDVFKLEERLNELKKRYTQNEYDVGKALTEAQAADQLAAEAEKGSRTLEARFQKADQLLRQKEAQSGNVKEQAERLKVKAMKLAEEASVKFSTLREIDDEFDENEKKLLDYSKIIEELNNKMKHNLDVIGERAEYHRNCNP